MCVSRISGSRARAALWAVPRKRAAAINNRASRRCFVDAHGCPAHMLLRDQGSPLAHISGSFAFPFTAMLLYIGHDTA